MQLVQPTEQHLVAMMSWFSNQQTLTEWSGPNFRYPFNLASFTDDLNLNKLSSYALLSDRSEFLAFGQYYQRLNKCHLGRLIVNPKFRGYGIAAKLMSHLSEQGLKQLKVNDISLFVLAHNAKAIKAYEKFGFSFTDYPDEMPLENCLYMVKSVY
ncbi:GNAT family N-acetyltransferase [Motilimonas sp. E26]|uniref:GNAT family N-acetyltransferase n=1 Tax=Motilimonas sp. E26 TaxID=2865674 RepID=UPI001E48D5D9|nr:GNAT family N-acetyltransferase [Motilimonas sp. E26]MCE0557975.1 GNAT family N-acetyltransferase [Motilimonas sp. E26]